MDYSTQGGGKKKNHTVIFLGICFVVLLGGIAGLFYYNLTNSQNRFEVLIEKTFDYLTENISKEQLKSMSGTFSIHMNGKSMNEESNQVFDLINKMDISGEYGLDYENKIINLKLDSHYDQKDLLKIDLYTESGTGYAYLDGLYDKYIKFPLEEYDSMFQNTIRKDDYKTVYASVENALLASLKEEYFTQEKATLDSKKVDKTILKLNKSNYQELKTSLLNSLLKDNSFLESMARILEKDVADVKDSLNKALKDDEKFEEVNLALYTKGEEFLQFEVYDDTERIVLKSDDQKFHYEFSENGKVVYDGSIQLQKSGNENTVMMLLNDKKENVSVQFTFKGSLEQNVKIKKQDVGNAVSYQELSENDLMGIYSKVLENEGMTKLIGEISKISGTLDNSGMIG